MRRFLQISAIALLGLTNPAGAGEAQHRLDLMPGDIEAVEFDAETVRIKLAPDAKTDLEQLTSQNRGELLVITVDGLAATESQINTAVDSGIVVIVDPSDELRAELMHLP